MRYSLAIGLVAEAENTLVRPGGGERGVVWSHAVFDQGTVNKGILSDGPPPNSTASNHPSSILVTEAFLIEYGKIRRVEMGGTSVPYHLANPFGGLTGN